MLLSKCAVSPGEPRGKDSGSFRATLTSPIIMESLGDARAFPLTGQILSDTMPHLPLAKPTCSQWPAVCGPGSTTLSSLQTAKGDGDKAASKDRLLPASAIPAARETVQTAALPLV